MAAETGPSQVWSHYISYPSLHNKYPQNLGARNIYYLTLPESHDLSAYLGDSGSGCLFQEVTVGMSARAAVI